MISEAAIATFERHVARVRKNLQAARRRGMDVPSDAHFDDFLARNRNKILVGLTLSLAQRVPAVAIEQAVPDC